MSDSSRSPWYVTARTIVGILVVFAAGFGARSFSASIGVPTSALDVVQLLGTAAALWVALGYPIGDRARQVAAFPRLDSLPSIFLHRKHYAEKWAHIRTRGRKRFIAGFWLRTVAPFALIGSIAIVGLEPIAARAAGLPLRDVIGVSDVAGVGLILIFFAGLGLLLGNREWQRHERELIGH